MNSVHNYVEADLERRHSRTIFVSSKQQI